MKISLRKVKSVAIGEEFKPDVFVPLQLPPKRSAVSVSVIGVAYSICRKYGIEYKDYDEADFKIYCKRQVVKVDKDICFLFVPSTQSSNSNSIKKYAESICDFVEFKDYLHFTHFGYLRTSFPSNQIKTILNTFIDCDDFECEVCWDIDEKFYVEMCDLLAECLSQKNKDKSFDRYDSEFFKWSASYDAWRDERISERDKRQRVQGKRISDSYMKATEELAKLNQFGRMQMVTKHVDILPNIGAVAAGNAGEYYALSLFIRMGFVAGKAPEGTSAYDLLVMSNDGLFFKPVQVKTITNGQHWLLKQRHEDVVDNLIFCFIKLTDISSIPKVYLIPAGVVSHVIKMCHEIYLALPNMQGGQHADSQMRTLKIDFSSLISNVQNPRQFLNDNQIEFIKSHGLGWLDSYEDNFNIFSTLT